jgi:polysaccharide export outer membrane protein
MLPRAHSHRLRARVISCLSVAAALAVLAPPLAAQGNSQPGLQPGDALRVVVWRKDELSGEINVAADSTLAHPLYRGIHVVGLPLSTVEALVRERILRFEANPELVVQPLYRVAVGGEVRQPNAYVFGPEVTVLQAVARAGGLTDRGRLDRVRLIRNGVRQVVDLSGTNSAQASLPIQSGDQIFVERRRDLFREAVVPAASIVAALAAVARIFTN